MYDETTPDSAESGGAESYGNTIDGSRVGDGSDARTDDGSRDARSGGTAEEDRLAGDRARQKGVYRAPGQPDHALGGTEGTTDGS